MGQRWKRTSLKKWWLSCPVLDIKKSMNLRTSVTDWKEGKVYRFQFVLAVQREKQRAKKNPASSPRFLKFVFFIFLARCF